MKRFLAVLVLLAGCPKHETGTRPPPKLAHGSVTISIVGTNDLHGAVDRLPILAGYVANLRATRAADGGAVLLIDAGDMFQGTLESNLNEGARVIEAYNAIGYTASTVGNHEFDFGPEGPAVTVQEDDDDPRGALKLRATEAKFPILSANVEDNESHARIKWKNMPASVIVDAAGVKVGIIGVATEATPFTTMPANFKGLAMIVPAVAIRTEAERLRGEGAEVIVVTAHVGSKCTDLADPQDIDSCDQGEELFGMVHALPHGLVDVIVAGHTHAAMAHRIDDVAVIESYSSGRAFGRVDLRIAADGRVVSSQIRAPQDLCPLGDDGNPVAAAACEPGDYEGKPVVRDAAVQQIADAALAEAKTLRDQPLRVTLGDGFTRSYDHESVEGNLFTDLMLAARADADVAMTNGGGLRADLPAGPLTYGGLYEAMPFDNRFAVVTLNGIHLRRLVTNNLFKDSGIFSWAGLTFTATCKGGELVVVLHDKDGKEIADDQTLTLVTSDFLASGGDGVIGRLSLPEGSIELTDVIIRDMLAEQFLMMGDKKLSAKAYFDASKPRMDYPGPRPVSCH